MVGAGLGMAVVIVHEIYAAASGHFYPVDPFIHILAEMMMCIPAGAALCAAVAEIRNRL